MKRIILLDANAIVHRVFHALPGLTSPDGKPTNAIYGFASIFLKIIQELKPDYILAAFDLAAPTFRHIAYERYKATRAKAPDELYAQIPFIKEMLKILSVPVLEKAGYEADDIIGTAAHFFAKEFPQDEIIIVTGDLDTLQLVAGQIKVFTMKKGISETVLYDEKEVINRFGFAPKLTIDYKGLRGDPSDNIPGVRGVGEKTATALIKKYGDIDEIYKNLKKITPESLRKKLTAQKEEAFFSRELATININVPLKFNMEDLRWQGNVAKNNKLREFFLAFGFHSLVRRLGAGPEAENSHATAGSISALKSAKAEFMEISDQKSAELFLRAARQAKSSALGIFPMPSILTGSIAGNGIFLSLVGGDNFLISEKALNYPAIADFFKDSSIKKTTFDAKPLAAFLRARGIKLAAVEFDAVLAWYLLYAHERNYEPRELMQKVLNEEIAAPHDCVPKLFLFREKISKNLAAAGLSCVLAAMEIPLIDYLVEMEHNGILLDLAYLKSLSDEIVGKIAGLEKEIYALAEESFNINSPAQVSGIIFKKLKLTTKGLRRTKTGAQSTDASELAKLAHLHPVIEKILQYRELQKLKTTYLEVLPALADKNGRIHTTFKQTMAVTGRLSSAEPNLQNIPVRAEFGKKIRRAFIARQGYALLAFDYSQLELRIAAHMSGDAKMISAFQHGYDIHQATAAEVGGVALEKVTSELRREAKTLNFGILYGMGAKAFAESAGISLVEAKNFIEKYFSGFAGLKSFLGKLRENALKSGFVETLFHRRRFVPELKSPYIKTRLEGERMAINMPIQGTAADIIKLAMNKIYQEIILKAPVDEIYPLLQVHDELIFEVKKNVAEHYKMAIKNIMENIVTLKVPITVDATEGGNWGDL